MPTKLLYLENTYLFKEKAKVVRVDEHEGNKYLVLDQTIFYPQGGGQPSDSGIIYNETSKFVVKKCVFVEKEVFHFGEFEGAEFEAGEEVDLEIDNEKRELNAKNHSAGHIIDLALLDLGLNLRPIKGFHFPDGPYVEYKGNLDNSPEFIQSLENSLAVIIQKNPKISFEFITGDHESGKPMRIMKVQGYPACPCGGTHIDEVSRITEIKIRKIKNSGDTARVAYQVS